MKVLNDWWLVLVILGYVLAFWSAMRRPDDFNKRLYEYLDSEFKQLNEKIDYLKAEFEDSLKIHERKYHQ